MTREKVEVIVGWVAVAAGVAMYASFIDQIQLNLAGQKGSWILATCALANSTLWFFYGILKRPVDWCLAVVNPPGIFLAATAIVTTFW
ncbi:hypothetical protein HYW60_02120 [Candidatus Kaiserbacteria bacterium]|nr:hypothetical protein [Candidatus Kaiserbacteria bacterium]